MRADEAEAVPGLKCSMPMMPADSSHSTHWQWLARKTELLISRGVCCYSHWKSGTAFVFWNAECINVLNVFSCECECVWMWPARAVFGHVPAFEIWNIRIKGILRSSDPHPLLALRPLPGNDSFYIELATYRCVRSWVDLFFFYCLENDADVLLWFSGICSIDWGIIVWLGLSSAQTENNPFPSMDSAQSVQYFSSWTIELPG